jgi:squalene-hopene/tetraprenyl-beta-curcumene cyclase
MTSNQERLQRAYQNAREALLAERHADGHWVGELSTSALSTATAVCALSLVGSAGAGTTTDTQACGDRLKHLAQQGLQWLAKRQNADGGWGDTTKSISNISTTMLARAAFAIAGEGDAYRACIDAADGYTQMAGGTTAVRKRYGKDRTFAVPILMTCALAGQVAWAEVGRLPFELAALPHKTFKWLNLPVVSYALPALIAVGQIKFFKDPPRNLLVRLIRQACAGKSLRVLERIQPSSGGFLEAVPLTSFVTMSLAGMGRADHPVARRAVEFLVQAVRPDGSWPIDSNLSVWLTTLSVNALAAAGEMPEHVDDRGELTRWLLDQQYEDLHPYTNAPPGAWGWTHLPGSVPDADDTAGALLALAKLGRTAEARRAAVAGIGWLLDLQNRDRRAKRAGLAYLEQTQRRDGSWLPLWFGNQHHPEEENPTYGTARVLLAYRDLGLLETGPARRGLQWLVDACNPDGGWGAGRGTASSVEETALAIEALADARLSRAGLERFASAQHWLFERVESGTFSAPSPIGFYFAKLWYFERLYPLIFVVAALGRLLRRAAAEHGEPDLAQNRTTGLLKTPLRSG